MRPASFDGTERLALEVDDAELVGSDQRLAEVVVAVRPHHLGRGRERVDQADDSAMRAGRRVTQQRGGRAGRQVEGGGQMLMRGRGP